MMLRKVGLILEASSATAEEVSLVAAALQVQVLEHFTPLWGIPATISHFPTVAAALASGHWRKLSSSTPSCQPGDPLAPNSTVQVKVKNVNLFRRQVNIRIEQQEFTKLLTAPSVIKDNLTSAAQPTQGEEEDAQEAETKAAIAGGASTANVKMRFTAALQQFNDAVSAILQAVNLESELRSIVLLNERPSTVKKLSEAAVPEAFGALSSLLPTSGPVPSTKIGQLYARLQQDAEREFNSLQSLAAQTEIHALRSDLWALTNNLFVERTDLFRLEKGLRESEKVCPEPEKVCPLPGKVCREPKKVCAARERFSTNRERSAGEPNGCSRLEKGLSAVQKGLREPGKVCRDSGKVLRESGKVCRRAQRFVSSRKRSVRCANRPSTIRERFSARRERIVRRAQGLCRG